MAVFVTLLASSSPLTAQTTYNYTGAGANNVWSTAGNWSNNATPTFDTNAVLRFDYNFGTTNILATGASRTVRSLVFGDNLTGGTSFQIRTRDTTTSGTRTLTLNGGAGTAAITIEDIADTNLTTIQLGNNTGTIAFATDVDFTSDSSSALFIFNNVVTGTGALNKYGIGTVAFNRANTFSGGINIYEGNVQLFASGAAAGTGAVTLGAGNSSGNAVLSLGGFGTTALTYTNAVTVGAGSGTRTIRNLTDAAATANAGLSGAVTLNTNVTFDITEYTATTHDRITVSGAVTGAGGIVKSGTGLLILSNAANSFGGLQIDAGQVTLQTNATVTGLSGSGGSLALSGGTLTVNASADSSFGGGISGAGNLTKSGNGALTLSASNTYTGGTTLSAGTLRAGNNSALGTNTFTINGGTFASDGATARTITNAITLGGNVQLGDETGTGALTLGSVNLGGANRTLTVGNETTLAGALTNGGLVKAGAGTLNLSNSATSFGALDISAGRVAVQTNATITGLSGSGGDLALAGGTLTVNTSTNSSFAQAISGAGALAKSGAGTLVLSGANSYSGGTTLSAGTVRVGNDSALGTGTLAVTASSTLTSDGATARTLANAVTFGSGSANVALISGDATGTGALTLSGPVTFGGAGSKVFTVNNAPMTVSGVIGSGSSSGAMVKNGSGTLVLANAANTFTNNVSLQAGTLQVTKLSDKGTASSIGTMAGANFLQIGQTGSSATLEYAGTGDATDLQVAIGNGDGGGSATILNNGSGALVFSHSVFNVGSGAGTATNTRILTLGGANTGANEIQGVISDITSLNKTTRVTKSDAGTWILSGANTYSGITVLSAGTLRVGNDNALGTGGFTINGGVFASDGTNARTIANAVTLGGDVQLGDATGTGSLTLGDINLGTDTRTFTVSNNTTVAGAITNTGGLTKAGTGTMTLSGDNTYSGATTVNAGTLLLANGSGLGTTAAGTTVASGAQLRLNATNSGFIVGNEALTISGQGVTSGGALRNAAGDNTWQGRITLATNATIGAASGTTLTLDVASGNAIEAANFNLTFDGAGSNLVMDAIDLGTGGLAKIGSGTTTLNGTLGASSVDVQLGTLALGSAGRLTAGATANVSGGTLSTGGNETITRLNATGGTVNLTDDTLTVTGTNGNASTVASSATLTGGTLSVQGALAYQSTNNSTTALSVASGGTLSGSGTTTGTLSVGGNLAPGSSTGIMNVGSTTFLGGGSYAWEIDTFYGGEGGGVVGPNWDFLNITGDLTISATSQNRFIIDVISLLASTDTAGAASNFNDATNYTFAIATASGAIIDYNASAFNIVTSGFTNTFTGTWGTSVTGNSLNITYTAATAIPEPSSAALTLIGLGVLALRRRCRR